MTRAAARGRSHNARKRAVAQPAQAQHFVAENHAEVRLFRSVKSVERLQSQAVTRGARSCLWAVRWLNLAYELVGNACVRHGFR